MIDENNDNVGLVSFSDAIDRARQAGKDLVEVAGNSNPAVCRIMDFGKFQYEASKKKRESRKKQHHTKLKEIQFHPRIEEHDYQTKLNHLIEFLKKGHKVKVVMFFRGREMAHIEIGEQVLNRVMEDASEFGKPESRPKRQGRTITTYLSPVGH
jgi:translation initiation factor IF-3